MNRREFLKGGALVGVAAVAKGAVGAVPWSKEHEPEVADGAYSLEALAGEPVLEAPAETSIGVAWVVSRLATGSVEVADNPEFRDSRIVKSGGLQIAELDDRSLSVRVTGLKPATRYWYRTITQEVVSRHHPLYAAIRTGERSVGKAYSFMTPGAAGASRFAVLNDTHCQWDSLAFVAAALKKMKAPLAIWNGDALNCTENRRTAVEAFLYPNVPTKDYAAETPLAFLYGNHEYGGQYAGHIDEVMMARPQGELADEFAALKWNFAIRQGEIALLGLDTGDGLHEDDLRGCGLGNYSAYRKLQAKWLAAALERPEIRSAPYAVAFCHIPLYNSGPNPNGGEAPREKGCASWIREAQELWGPVLERHHVQLVIAGHEHLHRWDEDIPGYTWKQVLGGGPECGYGAGYKPDPQYCPTIIEGEVKNGKLVITTHDVWRNKVLSVREFGKRI